MKQRLLIMASTFPRFARDNQPQFVLSFASQLAGRYEVTVLAPHDQGARFREIIGKVTVYRFPYFLPKWERLAYRGGMVNTFRSSHLAKIQLPLFLLMEFLYALGIVLFKRISLINAHWLFPQGAVALPVKYLTRAPLIVTTHGGDVELLDRPAARRLLGGVLRGADAVTFVSGRNAAKASAHSHISAQRSHILPMGIELPSSVSPRRIGPIPRLIFIGRLVDIKGVTYLIDAVHLARQQGRELKLDILGDGPLRASLVTQTHARGLDRQITFHGFVEGEAKDQLLGQSDIMVVPSITDAHGHEEGLPVTALEALSHGKVLIATRTGSLPELLADGAGLLVDQKSPEAILQGLREVIEHPAIVERLQRAGRSVAQNYSWATIVERFDQIVSGL